MPYLRRIMLVVGCLSVWVTPLARADSFIIELTNGREMRTSHVWEEGDALKFYTAQGTVGVPKALVKQIRTADRARHDQLSSRAPAPPAPAAQLSTTDGPSAMRDQPEAQARQARGQGSVQQSTQEQGEAGLHAKDANAYRAQKATLTSQ